MFMKNTHLDVALQEGKQKGEELYLWLGGYTWNWILGRYLMELGCEIGFLWELRLYRTLQRLQSITDDVSSFCLY